MRDLDDAVERATGLPPTSRPFFATPDATEDTSLRRRALTGALASAPLWGVFSGYQTLKAVRARAAATGGSGFSPDAVIKGFGRGFLSWAPFGVGGALFYALEYAARPMSARFAGEPGTMAARLFGVRHTAAAAPFARSSPPSQYEAMFGGDAAGGATAPPETIASRMLGGAGAGAVVFPALWALRVKGFRTISGVAGMTLGSAVAASMMPSFEEVEKRASW